MRPNCFFDDRKRRALFHLASKRRKSRTSRRRLNACVASLIRAKDQRANHSARGQLGISKSKGTANTLSLWRNDDSCLSRSRNVERAGCDIDRICCLCLPGRQRASFSLIFKRKLCQHRSVRDRFPKKEKRI